MNDKFTLVRFIDVLNRVCKINNIKATFSFNDSIAKQMITFHLDTPTKSKLVSFTNEFIEDSSVITSNEQLELLLEKVLKDFIEK